MSAFARQSINGLWITGLVLDNQQVALRGRALNPDLIPAYVTRLNKEPALQGRSFRVRETGEALSPVTFSAGVVMIDDGKAEDAITAADALLYRAKVEGRDRVLTVDQAALAA